MSTFIKGDAVVLSLWDDVSAYEPIACLTSNSLSLTRSVIETQTKCDPGSTIKTSGGMSYDVPFEAVAITTESGKVSQDELLDLINATTGTSKTWRMDDGNSSYYYGTGELTDLEITAAAGDEFTTFSGTIAGSGLIVRVDPNV